MKIVVTGDVTMDWHLAYRPRLESGGPLWMRVGDTRVSSKRGGAALLADLIEAVAKRHQNSPEVAGPIMDSHSAPNDPRFPHAFAVFKEYPQSAEFEDKMVWRAAESLGVTQASNQLVGDKTDSRTVQNDSADVDLVALDDAGFGFNEAEGVWPMAFKRPTNSPWVLLKLSGGLSKSPLLQQVAARHSRRCIVVIPANDLRRAHVLISRQLSWERTAYDIVNEWQFNSAFGYVRNCANVIVSFGPAGAIHLRQGKSPTAELFFDGATIEDQWEKDQGCQGGVYGYTVTLTAAIAHELMRNRTKPDFGLAIQAGIKAIRRLCFSGYAAETPNDLVFPLERVAEFIVDGATNAAGPDKDDGAKDADSGDRDDDSESSRNDEKVGPPLTFSRVNVPVPTQIDVGRDWKILTTVYEKPTVQIARNIVRLGLGALPEVPVATFGKLSTVDRAEIESLRSIRNLIEEYRSSRSTKPLSIAVFGPPGAGKSFGVKEVAKGVLGDSMAELTFNLSQFGDPSQLIGAFHQVRDASLSAKTPLVFWDEFDSSLGDRQLAWLRYFLAPMQDGNFQEAGITHPIGHSIFVFAGGTAHRVSEWGWQPSQGGQPAAIPGEEAMTERQWKGLKGPDFKSRLKGFLDVLGPNPQKPSQAQNSQKSDTHYIIRRAILLRALLGERAKQFFDGPKAKGKLHIDRGVLNAFLTIDEFKNGARSMEAIIAMSVFSGRRSYERSCLPSPEQLDLHVDGEQFIRVARQRT